MHKLNLGRARPLGLVAAAALAVGLTSTATLVAPAGAAPNAGSATIANHTLVITGSNGPDAVTLSADATQAQVAFANDPANTSHFNLSDFNAISVSLGNGDDQFTEAPAVLANKPLTVDGGNGNDTIKTGDGNDTIFGGNGDDHVDAGKGNDTVSLGNGNDSFVWTPGEGSDAVDGGNGNSDVMQFVGADGNEIMSLSANGSAAVFLRNVANIRMDLSNIELFDLQTLGGIDNVTVNDLSGTSIRQTNIDLSATNGAPDQAADVLTVNGTNQADRVNVSAAGGQVDVAGLAAETHITGSETLDHLQVNTHDGNDRVNVDPNVATLIGVAVDLGPGQL
jgi:RTX calcium-binding nonapeptide repeat (4 copies)